MSNSKFIELIETLKSFDHMSKDWEIISMIVNHKDAIKSREYQKEDIDKIMNECQIYFDARINERIIKRGSTILD
jgi:hypothetical protein